MASKKSVKKTAKSTAGSKKSTWKKSMLAVLAVTAVAIGAGGFVASQNLGKTYKIQGEQASLNIRNGESYHRFIDKIAKEQDISMPIVLKLYQKFFIRESLKTGVYEIKQGMSVREVLDMVASSENVQMNRILVIEGTTFKQLIQQLKNNELVEKTVVDLPTEQLLKELNIPETHPEGLFAPDTYFFKRNETDKQILLYLYNRQKKVLETAWAHKADDLPYKTPYEALIMASIIEKETNIDNELPQVSGVFYRRLKMGMKLQTDPTVIYGMGDAYKGNISRKDLQTPTAYNTYTIPALPPTPISLPSQKAIEATLNPDKSSKAIYFVATGKGGHKFSETLEQHNAAVKEYLAVLEENKKAQTAEKK